MQKDMKETFNYYTFFDLQPEKKYVFYINKYL